MSRTIRLGISTCPNDTFTFHALLNRLIDWRGLEFQIQLLDIQQLNDQLFANAFDVAKCSFHAALLMSDTMYVLPPGSALGFGVGPLLLAADKDTTPETQGKVTLCPGQDTTATLLQRLFYPATDQIEQVVFSEIMPRLVAKTADFGVCIHEGRFTWQDQGLNLVEDLGTRWERETNGPLPLGGLVGKKELESEHLETVCQVIGDSLQFALASPESTLPTMRNYAQEFDDDVLMKHVELYVNDWTVDLGEIGTRALRQLNTKALAAGVIPKSTRGLEIFSP